MDFKIEFGRLFHPKEDGVPKPDQIRVITDVGHGKNFMTGVIVGTKRKPIIPMLSEGTSGAEHIYAFLPRKMNVQDVISAYQRGYELSGFDFSDEIALNLKASAKKPPRTINWP